MLLVSLVRLHVAACTDESRVRRVFHPSSDTATQHGHRHDGKHVSADHSQVRERVDATGACMRVRTSLKALSHGLTVDPMVGSTVIEVAT